MSDYPFYGPCNYRADVPNDKVCTAYGTGSLSVAYAIVGVRNIIRVNPGDCCIKIAVEYGRKWK
jgi:hypothetical protein